MDVAAEELAASVLGTKSYWDDLYDVENANFTDHGDSGEVWFGEQSVRRIVGWMEKAFPDRTASVLDLGCGNGNVLLELADEGFTCLTGVDYSESAIKLANAVKEDRPISYEVADILDITSTPCLAKQYSAVIDKGTYDAISLCPDDPAQKRSIYLKNTSKLLTDAGLLCITSCNWTGEELRRHFLDSGFFQFHSEIPVKQFTFGGQKGQTVSCLVFAKH